MIIFSNDRLLIFEIRKYLSLTIIGQAFSLFFIVHTLFTV